MMYNLLKDKIFSARLSSSRTTERLSLPELYVALMRDEIDSLMALRPHQQHALHTFLAQLGALAVFKASLSTIPDSSSAWEMSIRALTKEYKEDEPWTMIVDDIKNPAFLQSPVPEDDLSGYKKEIKTPDDLDILITAKNHDVKQYIAAQSYIDDWVYALINLQTMSGYLGGYRGIIRMNGGSSSRCVLNLAPAKFKIGHQIKRDISVILNNRDELKERHDSYNYENGIGLVWLEPWDGIKQIPLSDLEPWFIEICRRIRFVLANNGEYTVYTVGSKKQRIAGEALNGCTGDPWMPVDGKKSFTIKSTGFGYRDFVQILFDTKGGFEIPVAAKPTNEEKKTQEADYILTAKAIAGGQGKTQGWHERTIPVSSGMVAAFDNPEKQKRLGDISRDIIEEVKKINDALTIAIAVYIIAGAEMKNASAETKGKARKKAKEFCKDKIDLYVDQIFFDELRKRYESNSKNDEFIKKVKKYSDSILHQATQSLPCKFVYKWRALTRSESIYNWSFRNSFPDTDLKSPQLKHGGVQ